MIIKASKRRGSKQLAEHLLNGDINEDVKVYELRDCMSRDLKGALQEMYATSLANKKIKSFMVSASFNPPKGKYVSVADFVDAANRAEAKLKLTGQPRVIVFHEKKGRRHMHVVWSRIDENLKAIKKDFDWKALNKLSRELFKEHGWELPAGYKNKQERNVTNFELSDWQVGQRQQRDPKAIKTLVQTIWKQANDIDAFKQALTKEHFVLAKGNKRSFVLVDIHGDVRALSRTLSISAKEVKAKLGDSEILPTVDEAKQSFSQTHKAEYTRRHNALIKRHQSQLMPFTQKIKALADQQKDKRQKLAVFHEQRQIKERHARQAQYPTSILQKVWQFATLKHYTLKKRHEAEYEANLTRDRQEVEALTKRQLKARHALQQPLDALKTQHQAELLSFNSGFVTTMQELGIKAELTAEFEPKQPNQQKTLHIPRPEIDL